MNGFTEETFGTACRELSQKHKAIRSITETYGFPPMYQRPFGFDTLVKIILEQQVSLASGRAVYNRLMDALGSITPHGLLLLNQEELRSLSVSRQKAGYLHHLSQMVANHELLLEEIPHQSDDEVRQNLMKVKGIGPWTADVVLMLCLQRTDVFPIGDVALVNSVRQIHQKPGWSTKAILQYAAKYAPYRTAATFCYWHAYICRKNISL